MLRAAEIAAPAPTRNTALSRYQPALVKISLADVPFTTGGAGGSCVEEAATGPCCGAATSLGWIKPSSTPSSGSCTGRDMYRITRGRPRTRKIVPPTMEEEERSYTKVPGLGLEVEVRRPDPSRHPGA
ncbi:hypothetical protein NUW54_g9606 [Trametes sanguinea]|uniref:Uncharacterized protein n=1 Tax=Trametes sanguinea TaxID=158606 RepID=A0ACC1P5X1_9APHY|nr:hypothetical protein NUW54_g9606 [Trametes sanguinea]